jgi:hypothetical protein
MVEKDLIKKREVLQPLRSLCQTTFCFDKNNLITLRYLIPNKWMDILNFVQFSGNQYPISSNCLIMKPQISTQTISCRYCFSTEFSKTGIFPPKPKDIPVSVWLSNYICSATVHNWGIQFNCIPWLPHKTVSIRGWGYYIPFVTAFVLQISDNNIIMEAFETHYGILIKTQETMSNRKIRACRRLVGQSRPAG